MLLVGKSIFPPSFLSPAPLAARRLRLTGTTTRLHMDAGDQSPEEVYSVWALPPEPCVYLLLEPTPEVVEASDHCCGHFGYERSTPYMPHVSLLYGDLTDEEKEVARKKVEEIDKEICGLQFEISELALYMTDTEDKSLESWELVEICHLERK
uniref:Cyclic phosphodiesterase n=1 Tax=Oryza barthii TaxID=65489 RepID=A0A0D3G9T8_9ORYZ